MMTIRISIVLLIRIEERPALALFCIAPRRPSHRSRYTCPHTPKHNCHHWDMTTIWKSATRKTFSHFVSSIVVHAVSWKQLSWDRHFHPNWLRHLDVVAHGVVLGFALGLVFRLALVLVPYHSRWTVFDIVMIINYHQHGLESSSWYWSLKEGSPDLTLLILDSLALGVVLGAANLVKIMIVIFFLIVMIKMILMIIIIMVSVLILNY